MEYATVARPKKRFNPVADEKVRVDRYVLHDAMLSALKKGDIDAINDINSMINAFYFQEMEKQTSVFYLYFDKKEHPYVVNLNMIRKELED